MTDLESDGVLEVIAAGMNGYLYRIDAVSGTVGWSEGDPAFEAYASPAVGQFDEDSTLDVVAVFNKGAFPNYTHSEIVWRNGATGRVIHEKNFAPDFRYSAASPLVVDFDGDGRDEVIVVLSNNYAKGNTNRLVVFDGGDDKAVAFSRTFKGFSGATPCLTDVDANGKLDLIHAHDSACLRFELTVEAETPAGRRELKPLVRWGEYRGPNGSGVFLPASSGGRTQP